MNPSMQKADKLLTGNSFEWFIKKWLSKWFFFLRRGWLIPCEDFKGAVSQNVSKFKQWDASPNIKITSQNLKTNMKKTKTLAIVVFKNLLA